MEKKKQINTVSEISGSVIGAAVGSGIGSAVAGPIGAVGGAIAGEIVEKVFVWAEAKLVIDCCQNKKKKNC